MKTSYELGLPKIMPYRVDGTYEQVTDWAQRALHVEKPTRFDPVLALTVEFASVESPTFPYDTVAVPVWRLWLGVSTYARLRAELGDEIGNAISMVYGPAELLDREARQRVDATAPVPL